MVPGGSKMSQGRKAENWIGVAKINNDFKKDHFFKVVFQAAMTDGSHICVIAEAGSSKTPIVGGVSFTKKELETIRKLGVEVVE